MLTLEEVKHIAKLSNLYLTDTELVKLKDQLSATLKYIAVLHEIETKNIAPTNNVNGLKNIWRKDETTPSFSQEEALKNAKSTYKGYFKVKAVLEEK